MPAIESFNKKGIRLSDTTPAGIETGTKSAPLSVFGTPRREGECPLIPIVSDRASIRIDGLAEAISREERVQ